MSLNPQDIVKKEFREAFRGYNQADVDLFLDEVVESFALLSEENQRMKVRIAALQQEVARLRGSKDSAAGAPAPSSDPSRLEAEVRTRVRRFLEEQLRALESPRPSSPAVDRMTRDLGSAAPATSPEKDEPEDLPPGAPSREPFWAGE